MPAIKASTGFGQCFFIYYRTRFSKTVISSEALKGSCFPSCRRPASVGKGGCPGGTGWKGRGCCNLCNKKTISPKFACWAPSLLRREGWGEWGGPPRLTITHPFFTLLQLRVIEYTHRHRELLFHVVHHRPPVGLDTLFKTQ